jgi:PAB-dependent poly(A)-specific ribonuclease subunit 2
MVLSVSPIFCSLFLSYKICLCSPDVNVVAFSNVPPSSNIMAVSLASLEMDLISPMTGFSIRKVPTTAVLTQLELTHSMLLSGSSDGYLRVHDPRTGMGRSGGAQNFVKAHARSVQGLQTAGNFLFSIGMGERSVGTYQSDL